MQRTAGDAMNGRNDAKTGRKKATKTHKDGKNSTAGSSNDMSDAAGWWRPLLSGEPDDLAGTDSRRAEPHEHDDTDSDILAEANDSGIQYREVLASDERRRSGRSLAAEGATAHACAAVPHRAPPQ